MAKSNNNNNSKPNYKAKSNNKGYRGGKSRSNSQSKNKDIDVKKDINTSKDMPGDINNPTYYYEDPTVLDQVMNFSFNQFGAVPIDLELTQGTPYYYNNPMVASYYLNPSIPQTSDGNSYAMDGITTTSLRNFLMLSGSNAKTTNYAPQDVTLLELAIAEVIKMQTWFARAFGVAYLFNYRNRSYPETLLEAMCIDAQDFQNNLAAYRVRFNKLLAVASKIPFPSEIAAFKKAYELYMYMYQDDQDSALAQTYMLNPHTTWLFNEAYDTNGAGLETTIWCVPGVIRTLNSYLTTFESMISALLNSTSLNFIYSDIMRLIQKSVISKVITFTPIPEGFTIPPIYNEEVQTWLHNAVVMGEPLDAASQYVPVGHVGFTPNNDLSCDANNNKVWYNPQFQVYAGNVGFSRLLDFDHDTVTLEEKVRATRFSHRYTTLSNGSNTYYTDKLALTDNYITSIQFFDGVTHPTNAGLTETIVDVNNVAPQWAIGIPNLLSKFDWAPLLYWYDSNGQGFQVNGDLDYYTDFDFNVAKRIYDYECIHFYQIGE